MQGRTFTELDLWQRSRRFREEIYSLSQSFPKDEKYRLADQLIRSSRSICANIAEGHGRFHYQENMQFCRIARGSLAESHDHLTCAFDHGFIDEERLKELEKEIDNIGRLLNGYINYLKKQKSIS